MALKDIIGQEKAINILKGCISRERIPHALLFAGDEGIGKMRAESPFEKCDRCHGEGHENGPKIGNENGEANEKADQ